MTLSMVLPRRAVALAVVVASAGLLAYVLLSDSDEERILARLEELARAVETSPGENVAFRTLRLKKVFEEALEPQVRFSAPELDETTGRRELAALAGSAPSTFGNLDVSIGSTDIRINRELSDAEVASQVTLTSTRGGELRRDTRQVRFELHESDGEWRVSAIRVAPQTDEEPEARP
jgi:hypothetical protein